LARFWQADGRRSPVRIFVEAEMNGIALILVACLPHSADCKQVVQRPAPASHEECSRRAAELTRRLSGTIDDSGYQPLQLICTYAASEDK
jgi:transcription antitermination factor NusG